jgi:hypothetical protein
MSTHRNILVGLMCLLPVAAHAQGSSGGLIGEWQGEVAGIGAARIIITGIKPGGQVEGRMEFELQSFVSAFGDKADSGPDKTNLGIASGPSLTIESALGGTYNLVQQGNTLKGTYKRGTTFNGPASFTRL